jgi:predicted Fe-S protein YdhL (DUF1289 family)
VTFRQFVDQRITLENKDDEEPFCPFHSPNCMGYCNVAYSDACYGCEEAMGEYVMQEYGASEKMCRILMERFGSVHTVEAGLETAREILEEITEQTHDAEQRHARSEDLF